MRACVSRPPMHMQASKLAALDLLGLAHDRAHTGAVHANPCSRIWQTHLRTRHTRFARTHAHTHACTHMRTNQQHAAIRVGEGGQPAPTLRAALRGTSAAVPGLSGGRLPPCSLRLPLLLTLVHLLLPRPLQGGSSAGPKPQTRLPADRPPACLGCSQALQMARERSQPMFIQALLGGTTLPRDYGGRR